MSQVLKENAELRKVRNHVESERKRKRDEKNAQIERVEQQTRAFSNIEVSKPPSEEYRKNYSAIFGHD